MRCASVSYLPEPSGEECRRGEPSSSAPFPATVYPQTHGSMPECLLPSWLVEAQMFESLVNSQCLSIMRKQVILLNRRMSKGW
jgi:hypothetical protein